MTLENEKMLDGGDTANVKQETVSQDKAVGGDDANNEVEMLKKQLEAEKARASGLDKKVSELSALEKQIEEERKAREKAEFDKKSDSEKLEAFSKRIEAYEAERVISSKLGGLGVDTSQVKNIIQGGDIEQSVEALAELLKSKVETAKTSAVQGFKEEMNSKIVNDVPKQTNEVPSELKGFMAGANFKS